MITLTLIIPLIINYVIMWVSGWNNIHSLKDLILPFRAALDAYEDDESPLKVNIICTFIPCVSWLVLVVWISREVFYFLDRYSFVLLNNLCSFILYIIKKLFNIIFYIPNKIFDCTKIGSFFKKIINYKFK